MPELTAHVERIPLESPASGNLYLVVDNATGKVLHTTTHPLQAEFVASEPRRFLEMARAYPRLPMRMLWRHIQTKAPDWSVA